MQARREEKKKRYEERQRRRKAAGREIYRRRRHEQERKAKERDGGKRGRSGETGGRRKLTHRLPTAARSWIVLPVGLMRKRAEKSSPVPPHPHCATYFIIFLSGSSAHPAFF